MMTKHPRLKPRTQHALRMLQQSADGLTSNEARELGCGDRFAARVHELRQAFGDGRVTDSWETHGETRYKRFRWVADEQTSLFA